MVTRLRGRTAIVTGGSRGIGAAIVQRFLHEGADVLVACRSEPEAYTDGAWGSRGGWRATDISKPADIEALFSTARERFNGKLDILVNNAAVQLAKTIDETSDEEWEWLNGINVQGSFLCSRAAVSWMRETGGGAIVNIGSIAAQTADREMAVYSASKAWLQGLTRAIATDHGRHGIRCNAVCPTWTMTEMSTAFFDMEADPEKAEAAAKRRHPLGRLAMPDDIAGACVWLASDEAAFVTGQCITVDGGLSAASPIDPEFDFR